MEQPVFGRISMDKVDKEKIMEIATEMTSAGVDFDKKIKEIARKYNVEYPAETSEALLVVLLAMISSIAGDRQATSIMIELLYRQHYAESIAQAIPMDKAKEMLEKMAEKSKAEIMDKEGFDKTIEEFFGKQESKSDDRPSYLG